MELNETITDQRKRTRSKIYHYIYNQCDFCTKQSLSKNIGISLPTVYQNLTELMEAGLIQYTGENQFTGGRRAMQLDIVADARIAIGINITDNCFRMVATDLRLKELYYRKIERRMDEGIQKYFADLSEELESFLDDNHINRDCLLGVGIALPAVISPDHQSISFAPTLHLQDVSFSFIQDIIPYPVHVLNDGTCGGYAEWFMHTELGHQDLKRNMSYLSLENGVGGALLFDNQIYNGDNCRSAEFGHMRVESNGLYCECGKRGCLETYCSAKRISDDIGLTLDGFFEMVASGSSKHVHLWHDLLQHLAVGVNLINMALDCDVVLGGFLSEYLEPWMPELRQYVIDGNPFAENGDFVYLSHFRSHTVCLGAALYFVKQFLDSI